MVVIVIFMLEDQRDLLVDLVNTLHRPDDDDLLADPRAASWLRQRAPANDNDEASPAVGYPGGSTDGQQLRMLRDLREGLRELAGANNGREPDEQILDQARQALEASPFIMTLQPGALRPLAATPGDAAQVFADAAAAYLAVAVTSSWKRVKTCANPGCQWAYVDASRNGSRRWCDMASCGNAAKQRAFRRRLPTAGEG